MRNVSAVIVTYNCGGGIAGTLAALHGQVNRIYVVDNGSNAETVRTLSERAVENPAVHLIRNETNSGLAAAQNQGISAALAAGSQWVLLLDDDSVPAQDMVTSLLAGWEALHDARFGIVAPLLAEKNLAYAARYLVPWGGLGFRHRRLAAGETLLDAAMVIASGSLIRADLLRAAGGMRKGFFMDGIDHEFCLRARRAGFRILVVGNAVLHHRQGNKTAHRLGGAGIVTPNYDPSRRYTIFRNRLFLLRLHGGRFPFLFSYEIVASLYDLARIFCVETDKKAKLGQALRGLWHGVTRPVPTETA